jgi:hypothetical protein
MMRRLGAVIGAASGAGPHRARASRAAPLQASQQAKAAWPARLRTAAAADRADR